MVRGRSARPRLGSGARAVWRVLTRRLRIGGGRGAAGGAWWRPLGGWGCPDFFGIVVSWGRLGGAALLGRSLEGVGPCAWAASGAAGAGGPGWLQLFGTPFGLGGLGSAVAAGPFQPHFLRPYPVPPQPQPPPSRRRYHPPQPTHSELARLPPASPPPAPPRQAPPSPALPPLTSLPPRGPTLPTPPSRLFCKDCYHSTLATVRSCGLESRRRPPPGDVEGVQPCPCFP